MLTLYFFAFLPPLSFLPPPFRRDRSQKSEASLREGSGSSGLDVKMAFTNSCCAKLRGLPFDATEEAVREFLKPFEPHGLFLCGGRSGEAYVDFGSNDQLQACVNDKNRQFLGARYVEFFTVSRSDTEENRSVQGSFVRAQGLPFSCTEADLAAFFGAYGVRPTDCAIKYKQMQYEMKPSGNGYARFPTAEAAEKACLELNRQTIGSRYIELFGADLS